MGTIDWALTLAAVFLIIGIAIYTQRYVRSVADFVAGGRAAGRYIICNAQGEAASGVANTVSKFQTLLTMGFVMQWWDTTPILILVTLSGWVVYRYRQTRAMTIGQFFEMRYSRKFRLFAGVLGFISGLLNYGIFPAVSATFFVYFMGLPEHVGPISTEAIIMAVYLGGCLFMNFFGGQVTLMIVDCVEGLLSQFIYLAVVIAVLVTMGWGSMKAAVVAVDAPTKEQGHSMVNPFNQAKTKNFNFEYQVMLLLTTIYGYMTVQKDNTFTSSARNPHESRMGRVLGNWRNYSRTVMLVVVSIAAFAYLRQPHFEGEKVLHSLKGQTYDQMRVPVALRYMLPVGIKGLFCAMMVLALTAGDAAHILTWGGVFVQDVILPFRGDRPLSPKAHVWALRGAIGFVAVFAFCFSQLFTQTQYVTMWWNVTEAIFAGGAGAAIIGGLYWKRGTTAGAWSGVIIGSTMAVVGILVPEWVDSKSFPDQIKWVDHNLPHVLDIKTTNSKTHAVTQMGLVEYAIRYFPNGMQMKFGAEASAIVVYVLVSLLTCRGRYHDMDKLLHRGKYAVADDQTAAKAPKVGRSWIGRLLEFGPEFTFWDKVVAGGVFFWSIFWLTLVISGSLWNLLVHQWTSQTWASVWFAIGVILPLIVGVVTLIWFSIGATYDMMYFFRRLSTMRREESDDGTVLVHDTTLPVGPGGAPATVQSNG